jgi:peptidoglycan/xylan/chitin deacetylase (PgdA/CDA1 family)
VASTRFNHQKVAYLSFDDGPVKNTEVILNMLKRYHIRATFFVIGKPTRYGIRMYRRMVREGHAIGHHTYSHRYDLIYSSVHAFLKDFQRLESLLLRVTGQKVKIMRFPGGTDNYSSLIYGGKKVMPRLVTLFRKRGYRFFDWNVDSGDAEKPPKSRKEIIQNVLKGCANKRRVIILFHDYNSATPKALPVIIRELRRQGFRFNILSKTSFGFQLKVRG